MVHSENGDLHNNPEPSGTCRLCSSATPEQGNFPHFGICDKCGYKVLIVLVVVMVIVSYTTWFGIF
jgi:hypothetical protein